MSAQVDLTVIEQSGVEVTVLDAPGAQIAIGTALSNALPQPLGVAASGTSTDGARADHVHAHGSLSGSSLHANATPSGAGFLSSADKTKLDAATASGTVSTLVFRNSSGDFTANEITADLIGNVTGDLTGVASDIADDAVTSAKILDETIVNTDISPTAAIAVSKLAPGINPRQLLQTNAAGSGVEWTDNVVIPGDLTVTGDLIVSGSGTTINTTTLVVEDKNIEIGKVGTPTDVTADGGGITLLGDTDKTINWVDATNAWTLSEHINLLVGKDYKINGIKVIDSISLGSGIVTSSLTSVGTISSGVWEGSPIGTAYGGLETGVYSDGELLIGKTDGSLGRATISGGTGIDITNGDGTIAISASGLVDANIAANASISLSKLATGALPSGITIASGNIVDGTITNTDINASAAIALSKLATGALPTGITIASGNIVDGTIIDADINASAAIALSKLATGALPSGITIASGNIVDGTITDADINASAAIALSKLATGALPSDITVASGNIVDGTITNAEINASAAIALSKLATGALPSGITIASDNIVDGTIVDADINASAAIALSKLATGALPSGITVASGNIVDGTITNADVNASAAIDGTKIAPDFGSQALTTTGLISANGKLTFPLGTAALPSLYPSGDTDTGWWSPAANNLAASTQGVERLRINADGRVGIGTSAPAALVHAELVSSGTSVIGCALVNNIAATNTGIILDLAPNGVGPGVRSAQVEAVADLGNETSLRLKTAAADPPVTRLYIAPRGNIGIGTTSPNALLTVNGNVDCRGTLTKKIVPTNSNVSTTATAESLLTGIRTGNPNSNIDLQLPTGGSLEEAFTSTLYQDTAAVLANDQALEWSVINLSSSYTITVTANQTGHTVVGNMVVAASTSARFASRKTTTNTFVTYRLS